MGDLEQFTRQQLETVNRIYAWHKERGDAEPARGYLGASIIGHECDRYLWYTFRGCCKPEFEGRLYRLFETGDLEEARFVKELRAIGCTVHDTDPETGEQFEFLALGGHFSGHMDGCALGIPEAPKTWHVLEFKTAKGSLHAKLKKEGVHKSYPKHWAQMQCYMGGSGMKRALYLSKNKDTDELYAERVKFEANPYSAFTEKASRIIQATQPPERMASRPDDWRCKFCDAHALCWGCGEVAVPIPGKTCKSCCHATPETGQVGAQWSCERFDADSVSTDDGKGCPEHLLLPGLVSFAEPVDSGDGWIDFKSRDGTLWRHGQGERAWSTEELITGMGPLGEPKEPKKHHVAWRCGMAYDCKKAWCSDHGELFVCAVCGQAEADLEPSCPGRPLPPELAEDPDSLLASYPWSDSERIWDGPAVELSAALASMGWPPSKLLAMEPLRTQLDHQVNAAEFRLGAVDHLVVSYAADGLAAIWRGKE